MTAYTETVCEDREADDVDLAFNAGQTWVAWSSASLERETVRLSRRGDDAAWSEPVPLVEDASARAFRPALAPLGTGVLLVGCARTGEKYSPAGLIASPDGRVTRFGWPASGQSFEVAAAGCSGRGEALVAWVEGEAGATRVRVARVDQDGRLTPVTLPAPSGTAWQSSPALACRGDDACAVWIEGDVPGAAARLIVARIASGAGGDVWITVLAEPMASSPTSTILSGGEIVVAWHASLVDDANPASGGGSALRWPRLAVVDRDGVGVLDASPPGEAPANRAAAGEDQGWEFPALAASAEDVLWLAGRSAQGFHLQAGEARTRRWSARLALSEHVWGGRGRRLAARAHPQGGVAVARREPDGVVLSHVADAPNLDRAAAIRPAATTVRSRAVVAGPPAPWPRTLFGDLHRHSAHSDGLGSAEDLWQDARDRRHFDFAALTDHDRLSRCSYGPATWNYHRQVVDTFNEPGRFVAFAAYEFTGPRHPGPGHKCIYFCDDVPDRVPSKDLAEIFACLRRTGGIAVPHHITWTGADVEHHDPGLQPVWEICSVHGCCDREDANTAFPPRGDPVLPGHFARDVLDAGLRFGFIGGTDSHGLLWHHGISPKRDPFSTGLGAVVGAEPTRAGIFAALRARRCYATTGVRIYLDVDFDGAPMGAELPAGTSGRLNLRVRGTAPLARVMLVRPGGDTVIGTEAASAALEATVDIAPDPKRPWEYLYVQVVQRDGEMAWSSPIWIG